MDNAFFGIIDVTGIGLCVQRTPQSQSFAQNIFATDRGSEHNTGQMVVAIKSGFNAESSLLPAYGAAPV